MSPRRANPACAAVSAFTLIELMVVMGLVMVITVSYTHLTLPTNREV